MPPTIPTPVTSGSHKDTAGPVQDCLQYLGQKDDTSRFVGLTLLLSLMRQLDETRYQDLMIKCTQVLDGRFLDRLLKTGTDNEAMTELAVHVIEALATALVKSGDISFLIDRFPRLIYALETSTTRTQEVILGTLLGLLTIPEAARAVMLSDDLQPIYNCIPGCSVAHRVVLYSFVHGCAQVPEHVQRHMQGLVEFIGSEILKWRYDAQVSGLDTLQKLFKSLETQVHPSPGEWIIRVFECLRMVATKSSSSEERVICSGLAAKLLDIGPPESLFPSQQSQGEGQTSAFLFVQLITIDIRSMYPTLVENPQSPTYIAQSHQQADRLDILSRFLAYLVELNDISEIGVEPNLILRLREDISESIAMTIEFLRDRWDDARFSSSEVSTRATSANLTKMRIVHQDPLLMGAIHAVSLWLKEEDSLRKEATGIIDIFLAVWNSERAVGFDHRHVILCALQALANEKEARQQILTHNGWNVLWKHIESIYIHAGSRSDNELFLAINTATLLSDILRVEMVGQMDWAQAVTSALQRGVDKRHVLQDDLQLQLQVAFLYLASSCYIGVRMTLSDAAESKVVLGELRNLRQSIFCNPDKAQYPEWITQCLEDITEDLGV